MTKPDCNGVFTDLANECLFCEKRNKCREKREEIEKLILKYGDLAILPFLHGATVAVYAEEHLDMKEIDE
jgi:hypothetical protein